MLMFGSSGFESEMKMKFFTHGYIAFCTLVFIDSCYFHVSSPRTCSVVARKYILVESQLYWDNWDK